MKEIKFNPIGIIHSDFKKSKGKPIQSNTSKGSKGWVEIFKDYKRGLKDIESIKIFIKNLDILDWTPLLDIKPYVPKFDFIRSAKIGWLEKSLKKL